MCRSTFCFLLSTSFLSALSSFPVPSFSSFHNFSQEFRLFPSPYLPVVRFDDELTQDDFAPFLIHRAIGAEAERIGMRRSAVEPENSIVIRILPRNEQQLLMLQTIESQFDGNSVLDFWTRSLYVNKPVDIMVPRKFYDSRFKFWMERNKLIDQHSIMIPNVKR